MSNQIYIYIYFQECKFISVNQMVRDVSQIFLEYIFMKDTKDVDLVSFKKKKKISDYTLLISFLMINKCLEHFPRLEMMGLF